MRRTQPTPRRGFTLIELIAAATLTAILMVAVALTLRQSLADAAMADAVRAARSPHLLESLLAQDIGNARGLASAAGEAVLTGYLASDPATGQPTLGRATVVYRIDRGRLLRIERSGGQIRTDLLWLGVAGLAFDAAAEEDSGTQPQAASETGGLPPIAGPVSVRIVERSGRAIVARSFPSGGGR